MSKTLKERFKDLENGRVGTFGNDISTPRTYRQAIWHFHLFDHGFLRAMWHNLAEIAPGVWRSNQPSPRRIKKYQKLGIKTVLSLRGNAPLSYNLLEQKACEDAGIKLIHIALTARRALEADRYLGLLEQLESMEKPFLFHCKSGADRAGLTAALYLLHIEDSSLEDAKKQLNIRFMHLKSTKTGVLDYMLDVYEADMKVHGPMPIKTWFETHYDHQKISENFVPRWNL